MVVLLLSSLSNYDNLILKLLQRRSNCFDERLHTGGLDLKMDLCQQHLEMKINISMGIQGNYHQPY